MSVGRMSMASNVVRRYRFFRVLSGSRETVAPGMVIIIEDNDCADILKRSNNIHYQAKNSDRDRVLVPE